MRSHLLKLLIPAIVLTVAAAPAVRAQQILLGGGNPVRIGFNYHGLAQRGADGTVRFADFPVVTAVDSGSAPQAAGLAPGDEIIEVNGHDGREAALFRVRAPGTKYSIRVRRGTDTRQIDWVVEIPAAKP
jgi:C-terminal processing protease CtpA/Prc